jgi:predicted ATPase
VFAGGWTLDAAEAVCADDVLARGSVAPSLARLVDASLVTIAEIVGDRRFTMLDTMGHFAAEQLDAAGETHPLRARHLDWCHALARRVDANEAAIRLGSSEFANVRLALESMWYRRTQCRRVALDRAEGRARCGTSTTPGGCCWRQTSRC